ncbi:MAG: metalloregulator ArsR/SmtB family transcription factor [Rhizobiaceae bacterium]|nr:metalloregulator ArsR/SmtB family transcription factor [Rhizobiaceae bacterium]
MLDTTRLKLDETVSLLRAAGEQTRLRLLVLLSNGDLTVSELIDILGQSQPRISRHLKLLTEAGLLERYQEGAWAYFRATDSGPAAALVNELISRMDSNDQQVLRDGERLEELRARRATRAADYFSNNAGSWDQIRSFHVDDAQVEAAMLDMVGSTRFQNMLDIGTGTGRVLELFAPYFAQAAGLDGSRDMLAVARANLDKAGLSRVQTRQGDVYMLPMAGDRFNLVSIHQVLHYLDDPAAAIREASKALAPSGQLLIVDFAPHNLDILREEHAHLRLGFSNEQMCSWMEDAGLEVIDTRRLDAVSTDGEQSSEKLTVSLWLARDQRLQMADNQPTATV